tara:strand:- start:932 stop:1873 length:942 start_codon:yes stop_codon:yes gene_type:complete
MIKKIYGQHTFCFTLLTILLSITAIILEKNFIFLNKSITSFGCLFLIISIGISHGAMDNYKGKKLLKIYKQSNLITFYIIYILISVLVILSWLLFASLTLLVFLLIASYHFGREDTSFLHKGNSYFDQFFYLIKGSLIVFSPLFFQTDETLKIFETLFLNEKVLFFLSDQHWIINICIGFCILAYFYFVFKNKFKDYEILFLDLFSILILNYIFSPLIAFTIYFCFLHSVRHIVSISYELNESSFSEGLRSFIKKALPLTILTAFLYLLAVVFLSNTYGFNDVIIKVIFIGLASLTFPHILLEYILEKNEKRT